MSVEGEKQLAIAEEALRHELSAEEWSAYQAWQAEFRASLSQAEWEDVLDNLADLGWEEWVAQNKPIASLRVLESLLLDNYIRENRVKYPRQVIDAHLVEDGADISEIEAAWQRVAGSKSAVWDPVELLLTASEVPAGFPLRDAKQRMLVADERGGQLNQAYRVYGKARFLRTGDSLWSEANVFEEVDAAREGWARLVEHHKQYPEYASIREIRWELHDEAYVHAGTMGGKPGLWAAVRIGVVVHRFNTAGVNEVDSTELLRRQLSKQGPQSPAVETGARGVASTRSRQRRGWA